MGIEANPLKIIQTIFHLESSKGHLKWSVSEVSRRTKLSRSTIYHYFGTNKQAVLKNALIAVCDEFYGVTRARQELAKTDFMASARITRDLYKKTPEYAIFSQVWRTRKSEYQMILVGYEQRYEKKLAQLFPKLSVDEVTCLHVCLHGLMTAPFLSDDSYEECLKQILRHQGSSRPT